MLCFPDLVTRVVRCVVRWLQQRCFVVGALPIPSQFSVAPCQGMENIALLSQVIVLNAVSTSQGTELSLPGRDFAFTFESNLIAWSLF